jgi:hypothetical protein
MGEKEGLQACEPKDRCVRQWTGLLRNVLRQELNY